MAFTLPELLMPVGLAYSKPYTGRRPSRRFPSMAAWSSAGVLILSFSHSYGYKYFMYCVRSVNAALVIELGRLRPLVISRQSFLLMTSTRPPLATTSRYNSYRSRTCLAIMGMRLTGEPRFCMNANKSSRNSFLFRSSDNSYN